MNDAEAAKHIAKMNGRGSNPIFAETTNAIGVINIAVAALDDTSVKTIVIKYIKLSKANDL